MSESPTTLSVESGAAVRVQRLVRAPFYSDEWVTIYNADAREMVEELEPGFALLTDPVYDEDQITPIVAESSCKDFSLTSNS